MASMKMVLAAAALSTGLATAAHATPAFYPFSGSGSATGTLASPTETFTYSGDTWSAMGTYGETFSAFRFQIAFAPSLSIVSDSISMTADGVTWLGVVGPGPYPPGSTSAVEFSAPGSDVLATGESFTISVTFSGPVGTHYSYAGDWVYNTTAVPEPAALGLLGVGLIGLGVVRGRNKKAA